MTGPIDRLQAADPAAGLGPQPDERAEADLRLLLAEPQAAPVRTAGRERRRLAPALVTAFVALAVIALTAAVLAVVHPRTDVGGTASQESTSACRPFSCNPYFSAGGTGSLAFLRTTLFRLSFEHANGALTAVLVGRCNALNVALRPEGGTVVATGTASTSMLCEGAPGSQDHAVMRFFSGTVGYRIDGARLTFTSGSSSAVFSTDIGACRPSPATSPFCGSSTATGGSGSVAFLSDPYRITFAQSGSQLTAAVRGVCGTTTYDVTVGSTFRLRAGATSTHSCPSGANAHDTALRAFLESPLTYRWNGSELTLESADTGPFSSAVFTRDR